MLSRKAICFQNRKGLYYFCHSIWKQTGRAEFRQIAQKWKIGVNACPPSNSYTVLPTHRWGGSQEVAMRLKQKKRLQCSVDPCVYRYSVNDVIGGLEAIHVDDILPTCRKDKWRLSFDAADTFKHSGMAKLGIGKHVLYLGLRLFRENIGLAIPQDTFAKARIRPISPSGIFSREWAPVGNCRRRTICRQAAGGLNWAIQTGLGVSHRIGNLPTYYAPGVLGVPCF